MRGKGERLKLLEFSDYFISSSLTEGCPISVLEAIQADLIIILSDIDPHKEIIKKHNDIKYFKKGNYDSLYNKMKSSLLNKTNPSILSNEYFAKTMSKRYQKQYTEIILKPS